MATNREWLYSLDVADLSDWFDAEHETEHADCAARRIDELESLVRHLAACIKFGGWPCNDCPYEDHECEKEWYEAMKRLGV